MTAVSGATNWKTFGQVISENLGQGEKADYFTTKATLMLLKKDNCMYQVSHRHGGLVAKASAS